MNRRSEAINRYQLIQYTLKQLSKLTRLSFAIQESFEMEKRVPKGLDTCSPEDRDKILQNLDKTNDFLSQSDLTSLSPSESSRALPSCSTAPLCAIETALGDFKNYLLQLEDPLDRRIISSLMNIMTITRDTGGSLQLKYIEAVSTFGDSFTQFKDIIIDAISGGERALYHVLKSATLIYQMGLSKNARKAITDINQTATDMKVMLKTTMAQYETYKKSLEHITVSWNSFSKSVTNCMERFDKMNLDSHTIPSSSHRGAPSVNSNSESAPIQGVNHFQNGCTYASELGRLKVDDNVLTFTPTGAAGINIVPIFKCGIPNKTIFNLITRDLRKLGDAIIKNKESINTYSTLTVPERKIIIETLMKSARKSDTQWKLIE